MADFCNICLSKQHPQENIEYSNILIGDININKLYHENIKPATDKLLNDTDLFLKGFGLCESCGIVRLTLSKEEDKVYLLATCWKDDNNPNPKYKLAEVINDELIYIEEEINRYFTEH